MIEPSRRHGHFDPRWSGRYAVADGPEVEPGGGGRAPAGLDWSEFLRRFFPGRRRHDFEALKAYEAYRSESVSTPSLTVEVMSESLHVTIAYEDGEHGWVVASVPEVPGAMSQGRTLDEARANVIDALRGK